VSDEEFNRWALGHFPEILSLPGWLSAQRFRLEPYPSADDYAPSVKGIEAFRYMSLYELEGDGSAANAALTEASASGRLEFPDWFQRAQDERCFLGWTAVPLSTRQV
jgi:hypothetical protein